MDRSRTEKTTSLLLPGSLNCLQMVSWKKKMGNMRSVKTWRQQRVSVVFLRISQDITRCRAGWMPLPGCREKSVPICGKRSWRH